MPWDALFVSARVPIVPNEIRNFAVHLRKTNLIMALRPGDKYYTGLVLRFDDTIRRWAAQTAQQLRDSYRMQHMWNGSKSNEIYGPRIEVKSVKRYRTTRYGLKEVKVAEGYKTIRVKKLGWYDESKKRERDGNPKAWYSTGESYRISQSNPVQVDDATLSRAAVTFNTTLGALYAEAGVGLSGHSYVRGGKPKTFSYYDPLAKTTVRVRARRVKVDRAKPWKHDQRYAEKWVSKLGKTHRPNIRMQVNLLSRRLAWAARLVYGYNMAAWIAYQLDTTLSGLSAITWTQGDNGKVFGVTYDEKNGQMLARKTFEQWCKEHDA